MKITTALAVAVGLGALAACNQSPRENAAENIEANADAMAENIEENADAMAANIEANGDAVAENVEEAGDNAADAATNNAY